MSEEPTFAIPTCRLRDVGEAIKEYDKSFAQHGHSLPMFVFDDCGPAMREQYISRLTELETKNELYYVGHSEKAAVEAFICKRLRDSRLAPLVHQLFRPSYGGNRNFTLLYSIGHYLISADDDMRPFGLVDEDAKELEADEICRGRVVPMHDAPKQVRTFDLASAFMDVLGKTASDVPATYARGDLLVDTAMDLETNASKGLARENALLLRPGYVAQDAVVRMAQSFRSGTNDIDALDYVELFLENKDSTNMDVLTDVYVLGRFKPALTNKNWRMDCGVAGYDNRFGLPPFFPTRLRFEDYIYRLWIQQPGLVAAHVPAAQNHSKSAYMRNSSASEVLNEEAANLLKRKIHSSVTGLNPLGVSFDYDGDVDTEEAERILDKMRGLQARVLQASKVDRNVPRTLELVRFAVGLETLFHGFERDLFLFSLRRMLKDTVSAIRNSLALWPDILDICAHGAATRALPQTRIGSGRN
jgi:hypothetical protein